MDEITYINYTKQDLIELIQRKHQGELKDVVLSRIGLRGILK